MDITYILTQILIGAGLGLCAILLLGLGLLTLFTVGVAYAEKHMDDENLDYLRTRDE